MVTERRPYTVDHAEANMVQAINLCCCVSEQARVKWEKEKGYVNPSVDADNKLKYMSSLISLLAMVTAHHSTFKSDLYSKEVVRIRQQIEKL